MWEFFFIGLIHKLPKHNDYSPWFYATINKNAHFLYWLDAHTKKMITYPIGLTHTLANHQFPLFHDHMTKK